MMDALTLARQLFDPFALLLVGGGALGMAMARSTRTDVGRAFLSLRAIARARPDLDADAAAQAVNRIVKTVAVRSIACADRVDTAGRFVREAAEQLADARSAQEFERWGLDVLARRETRHAGAIGFWRTLADAAPAMGMIGTIVALVRMFAAMSDPATIGPAMALALLTTLYGVVIAGVIAGPIAARLERLSELERGWQRSVVDRLAALAHLELDRVATPKLRAVS